MAEPLAGLRAIEFGQLLAGPFTGTLLGDFGADVIKVEPPGIGDAMRDWGRLRHNDRSLWWSILARNKRSSPSTYGSPRASGSPPTSRRRPTSCSRTSARDDGEVGPRPRGHPQAQPARDLRPRLRLRPDRPVRPPPGLRVGGRGDLGLRHINGYPDQAPPRSGISLGDTLAAQSAFQGILLALYAREKGAEGQVVDASIVDACFAMSESSTLEYEKTGSSASRPGRGCRGSRRATCTAPRTASGS